MSETISALMYANLFKVFNERDNDKRLAAIAETYSEDVTFADPDGVVSGYDALNAKARKILDGAPGFVFTAASPVYESHDLGYLAWHFGPEGQPPVVSGADIAIVKAGRIATLHTFLTT